MSIPNATGSPLTVLCGGAILVIPQRRRIRHHTALRACVGRHLVIPPGMLTQPDLKPFTPRSELPQLGPELLHFIVDLGNDSTASGDSGGAAVTVHLAGLGSGLGRESQRTDRAHDHATDEHPVRECHVSPPFCVSTRFALLAE